MSRGRPPTTGRFATREELIEKVVFLARVQKLPSSQIANSCGVSSATVDRILTITPEATSKRKAQRQSTNHKATSSKTVQSESKTLIGLWCWCYQKVDGFKEVPFEGKIIEDLNTRLRLKIGSQTVTVNRAACSTHPYEKRKS